MSEAVAILRATAVEPFEAGLQRERETFLRPRESAEAKALRYLFLAKREAAKVPGLQGVEPSAVSRAVYRRAILTPVGG